MIPIVLMMTKTKHCYSVLLSFIVMYVLPLCIVFFHTYFYLISLAEDKGELAKLKLLSIRGTLISQSFKGGSLVTCVFVFHYYCYYIIIIQTECISSEINFLHFVFLFCKSVLSWEFASLSS